jgi:hypothetical protein
MSELLLSDSSTDNLSMEGQQGPSLWKVFAIQVARGLAITLAAILSTYLTGIAQTVTHSFIISVSMGGISFWLVCSFLLSERIETQLGRKVDKRGRMAPVDMDSLLGKAILDERLAYCQQRLRGSQVVSLKLIYCGSYTEQVQQFYQRSRVFTLDTFPLGEPEYLAVYGLIDSKGNRFVFLDAFAEASTLQRGYFRQVAGWPVFALYEIE